MALQVWLPLNGNLNNQGLYDTTIVNHSATVNSSGKIGSCYNFSNAYISGTYKATPEISFACWIYFNTVPSGQHVVDARRKSDGVGYQPMYFTASTIQLGCSNTGYPNYSYSWQANVWYHVVCIHDQNGNRFYVNGELKGSSAGYKGSDMGDGEFYIASRYNQSNYANVKVNDFRIYDHALSPREVAEIAKGLVLHYPLNDWYNASNLVYNGFGEHGSDGWSGTTVSTSDLPSDSNVKATFTGGDSVNYIPINPNDTFTVSCYLKTAGATSGTTYPSIKPYDIDKKFINIFNCASGFSNTWKTTLSQPLNTGDTVIHATDISNWSTATDNYYYHVAIFGYKDSTGYVYPDMEYTQDSPAFGTKTDKSKLNKTNNTITLNSAYTGEPRPAGTVICQATEGGTYYYPFGGIAISTLSDWTAKTATINFGNDTRLRNAKYITWLNYLGAKYAGIKIVDNTWGNTTVYDTSGFGYNGVTNGGLTLSSNTSRYNVSTKFNGSQYIQVPFPCSMTSEAFTVSCWGYEDDWNTPSAERLIGAATSSSGWCIGDYGSENTLFAFYADGGYNGATGFKQLSAGWHHFVITFNGLDLKYYLDGSVYSSKTFSTKKTVTGNYNIQIGQHYGGGFNFKGLMSDIRIYATALTVDQVKQLYEAPISLANNGTLMAYEFNEI